MSDEYWVPDPEQEGTLNIVSPFAGKSQAGQAIRVKPDIIFITQYPALLSTQYSLLITQYSSVTQY